MCYVCYSILKITKEKSVMHPCIVDYMMNRWWDRYCFRNLIWNVLQNCFKILLGLRTLFFLQCYSDTIFLRKTCSDCQLFGWTQDIWPLILVSIKMILTLSGGPHYPPIFTFNANYSYNVGVSPAAPARTESSRGSRCTRAWAVRSRAGVLGTVCEPRAVR